MHGIYTYSLYVQFIIRHSREIIWFKICYSVENKISGNVGQYIFITTVCNLNRYANFFKMLTIR